MPRLRLALCLTTMLVAACSSEHEGSQSTPQNVASWQCCALGDRCTCHEETPNSGVFCSTYVDSCGQLDGGVGCCVAAFIGDGWQCDCSAAGAACPTPGDNCVGSCPTPSSAQSVPSCPP